MKPADDSALIELAYSASFVTMIDKANRPWDKPFADVVPADVERECYRLATQLGLNPRLDVDNLLELQADWRRQLKQERQKELFDMGMLLVRQHALISYLQCHPQSPVRAELCFQLDEIRQKLTSLFGKYKLGGSLELLPALPLPGAPESWMTWSGDALRYNVIRELGGTVD